MHRTNRALALAITLSALATARVLAAPPGIFASLPLEEARKRCAGSGRLLVVDFSASWCGPCRRMDRATWSDPRVLEWMKDRAVAVQIDADKEPGILRELGVAAMPTVVVFRGGEVFDRVVGYQDADQLLGWLAGVVEGRRRGESGRAEADGLKPGGGEGVRERLERARRMSEEGRLDEATEAYIWLWENMVAEVPSMRGVRVSFMASDMGELARRHPAALARFASMRDAARARMDSDAEDVESCVDWQTLCEVVGDGKALLAWFDAVREDDARAEQLRIIHRQLMEALIKAGRWRDAGQVVEDPVGKARQELEMHALNRQALEHHDKEMQERVAAIQSRYLRESLAKLHACCLAASRDGAAAKVAKIALDTPDGPSMRVALVTTALSARQPREAMSRWLDEAQAGGEDVATLRERLNEALRAAADAAGPAAPPRR
jgi:thioredoxin-like negative regulator of GroEL